MTPRTVGMSQTNPLNRQINAMIETVTIRIRLRFNNRLGPHFTQWMERLQAVRLSIHVQSLHREPEHRISLRFSLEDFDEVELSVLSIKHLSPFISLTHL